MRITIMYSEITKEIDVSNKISNLFDQCSILSKYFFIVSHYDSIDLEKIVMN